jgi:enamine deaminase RidA (YjgF/YER057c/UK114 family)
MANLAVILDAAGASFGDVIRTGIYLTDPAHYAPVNEVYREFMSEPYPARTTVYVGLPAKVLVEIDMLAVLPAGAAA